MLLDMPEETHLNDINRNKRISSLITSLLLERQNSQLFEHIFYIR